MTTNADIASTERRYEIGFYRMIKLNTMTNEEIYENVMGHKPNKEFGLKGSFSWDDIDALMTAAKNYVIPTVTGELTCDNCGCRPNTIYITSKGRFCERCKPAS